MKQKLKNNYIEVYFLYLMFCYNQNNVNENEMKNKLNFQYYQNLNFVNIL